MKITERLSAPLARARVWLRERKEAAAEKRQQQIDPAGVTVPEWLVRAAHFASWIAMASLVYFLWLYTLDIARDRAGAMHITRAGTWLGDLQFWFPYIIGFGIVSFGIPYTAKIAIPTFMSLTWRGAFWPKIWALFIAACVSLVVIFGTFVIQGDTLLERDRDAAVAVAQVNNGRAAIQAQIDGITDDLRASTEGNSTQAQAARVGMLAGSVEAARAQWQTSYVQPALAAGDANAERIRRASGSAEAAAAAVARREALRQQLATAPVAEQAQEASTVQGGRNGWVGELIGRIEGIRAILLSFVMDIVALMMPWIALRLEQARNRQLGMAGGIPQHPWMITNQSDTTLANRNPQRRAAQDVADAMVAAGADPRFAADMARAAARMENRETTLKDADTDQVIIDRDGHLARVVREHTRKVKGKDGKPIQMVMPASPPQPDERGVETDGGERIASERQPMNPDEPQQKAEEGAGVDPADDALSVRDLGLPVDDAANAHQQNEQIPEQHTEPPTETYTESDLDALADLAPEAAVETPDAPDAPQEQGDSGEPDGESEHSAVPVPEQQDAGADDNGDAEQIVEHDEPQPETRPERMLTAPESVAAE